MAFFNILRIGRGFYQDFGLEILGVMFSEVAALASKRNSCSQDRKQ